MDRLPTVVRSLAAGLDPEASFRRHAGDSAPFEVIFPGLGRVHFFSTAAAARDLLTAPRSAFEAPTPNPIEPVVGPDSVILASGDDHRRKRRLLMPALHGEGIRTRVAVMARAAGDECAQWYPGDRIALSASARSIALRIIVLAVIGVENADQYQEFASVVTDLMRVNSAALMLLPWMRRPFAGRGPWARLVRMRGRFDELLAEAPNHPGDLRTMIMAGHDTTAGALMWALYHIHREPGVRDRVVAELADVSDPAEMPALPYLSAVVAEALRMHPAVPIVLRRLTAPLDIGGVRWLPGDVVGIALPALHFDAALWPEPYRFDPDRFLGAPAPPFAYLPFGGGYRRCPGATFATYELAVSIGTLMKSVALRLPAREHRRRPPRSVPRGIAVVPRREVMLEVTRRL